MLRASRIESTRHRGVYFAWYAFHKTYAWAHQRNGVCSFRSVTLSFLLAQVGEKVPRLLDNTLHAMKRDETIHIKYLILGKNYDSRKYTLVVKNDLTECIWLICLPVVHTENVF